jgi:hypothetical protein
MLKQKIADYLPLFVILSAFIYSVFQSFEFGAVLGDYEKNQYGNAFLQYYLSGFSNVSVFMIGKTYLEPAFPYFVAVVFQKIFFFANEYTVFHLTSCVFGALSLVGIYKISRLFGSLSLGLFALIFAVITPDFFGALAFDLKNACFSFFYIFSIYFLLKIMMNEQKNTSDYIAFSVAAGGAISTSLAGFFVCALWLFAILKMRKKNVLAIKELIVFSVSIPLFMLLIFYPFVWQNSFAHLVEALKSHVSLAWQPRNFVGMGEVTVYGQKRSMIFYNMLYRNSEILILLYSCFLLYLFQKIRTFSLKLDRKTLPFHLLLHLAFLLPFVFGAVFEKALTGFLYPLGFALAPFIVICAIIMEKILNMTGRRFKAFFTVLAFLYLAYPISGVFSAFPYPHLSFNSLMGGVSGALDYGNFGWIEIDDRKTANLQLLNKFDEYVKKSGVKYDEKPVLIPCGNMEMFDGQISKERSFEIGQTWKNGDFRLVYANHYCASKSKEKPIVEVNRDGAAFAYIEKF